MTNTIHYETKDGFGDRLSVLSIPGDDEKLYLEFGLQAKLAEPQVELTRAQVLDLMTVLAVWLGDDVPEVELPTCCNGEDSSPCCPGPQAGSALEDAQAAIYGDREDDYGTPRENWTRTAMLWTGLLQHKLAEGEFITPEDGVRCMVAVKLARDVHQPKRDNRVDGAGYFGLLDRLETGR